jgi:hypothetical protein
VEKEAENSQQTFSSRQTTFCGEKKVSGENCW